MTVDLTPVIPFIAVMSIPIVAILTRHQREMAKLLNHGAPDQQVLADMQRQINDLRTQLAATQAMLPQLVQSQLQANSLPPAVPKSEN